MNLRIPDPNQASMNPAGDQAQAPLANPFASGPGGFLTPEELESKPSRAGGVLVLLLVVAVAAGVLLGMRQMGMGPKLALADIKIDYPIEGPAPTAGADHERILADLQTGHGVKRVPPDMVQTNPFAWRSLLPKDKPAAQPQDPMDLSRRQAEERRAKITDAAAQLVLNSLMGGRVPMARIDGQLVRVGDRVGEYFTVASIAGRTVELHADDQVFTLIMGEHENDAPPPANRAPGRR